MSRLIYADALINLIPAPIYTSPDGQDLVLMSDVMEAIKRAPTIEPEPQWIPCSKRLPKKIEKDYWICTDEGWQCVCRWRKFPSMRGDFWAWNVMHPVVAWMPRPEPYREGD